MRAEWMVGNARVGRGGEEVQGWVGERSRGGRGKGRKGESTVG